MPREYRVDGMAGEIDDLWHQGIAWLEAAGAEVQGGRPIGPLAAAVVLDPGDGTQMSIEFELDPADNDRFLMIRSAGHSIGSVGTASCSRRK